MVHRMTKCQAHAILHILELIYEARLGNGVFYGEVGTSQAVFTFVLRSAEQHLRFREQSAEEFLEAPFSDQRFAF